MSLPQSEIPGALLLLLCALLPVVVVGEIVGVVLFSGWMVGK